ncbi:hypothetical protein LQ938_09250 [Microbacterium sp. cx-55]|uniref:hypothetical protein n=1 Tax=unclassified Microbacterium TaxID=2609290 RepID=UPI001CBE95F4|nr:MULTISPECIES: hypothetical protein [unclassified Microbacterium]MBZ4486052.1 hypothetical protein [Microbacterium sp. cx-55]MCC4907044.1 hypothetical protein [Microbacterium sp. cx-59]UGB34076.1 hypothetical protein LQ938_09250 [Microbacterium sp. cx-55]
MSIEEAASLRVDEDGFFVLVVPDAYKGFVDEDWRLDELLGHFAGQMNEGALFIAYPGPDDADSAVAVTDRPITAPVLREAVGIVRVTASGLWLTDYTQLTMAAQFHDESPTGPAAVRLTTPVGWHRVLLRQIDGDPRLNLTITPIAAAIERKRLSSVPWFE